MQEFLMEILKPNSQDPIGVLTHSCEIWQLSIILNVYYYTINQSRNYLSIAQIVFLHRGYSTFIFKEGRKYRCFGYGMLIIVNEEWCNEPSYFQFYNVLLLRKGRVYRKKIVFIFGKLIFDNILSWIVYYRVKQVRQ